MSILCQTFVQNAWRSDLCSNCFKSFEDHSDATKVGDRISTNTQRYIPQAATLYQSRCISTSMKWRLSEPIYERVSRRDFASQTPPKTEEKHGKGILIKEADRKLKSRPSVDFASEEALVIGYGGNDYDSDLSPWEMGSDDGSIDLDQLDDNDEDRKITKLTKNNTEYNSSNQNLLPNNDKSPIKEMGKQNNLKNSNSNIKTQEKSPEKSLHITYNNIQTEKIVSQYYYPSSSENVKLYLNNNNGNNHEINKANNNKENSFAIESVKVDNCKRDKRNTNEENCKNILNQTFTPLNTQTYSVVSELNKSKITSSEHSSASDYSTCRLTAGDSTDSESFHDADDARIEPCPSFLHSNFPKNLPLPVIRDLDCDKKYDGGSSTSGDVSNLSDDSDSHESTKRYVYKTKNSKISKSLPELPNKEQITISLPSTESSAGSKNIQVRFKESPTNKNRNSNTTVNLTGNRDVTCSTESPKGTITIKEKKPFIKTDDSVSPSLNTTKNTTTIPSNKNTPISNNSNNGSTVTSITGETVTSKTHSTQDECKKQQTKNPPIKRQSNTENRAHKQISKSISLDSQMNSNQLSDNMGKKAATKESLVNKELDESIDSEASPDTIAHRQSKLAALALELELARRDSPKSTNPPAPPTPSKVADTISSTSPPEIYSVTPKTSSVSCTPKLSNLPDVLQETPAKAKKNRFSLKKLLKRNKDTATFTPTGAKEVNPKAWKKQTFDRSRLSLEIVHPMDLTSDPATSGESTPTEEGHYSVSNHPAKGLFKNGYSRARSLSALPQISAEMNDKSNCSLLECRRVETLPARKAGTVAERKKNRPSLVRTPSCSALPNRSNTSTPVEENERTPPPKPPPPPKYKVHHPPPPPPPPTHLSRASKPNHPTRPPPPKIPDVKYRQKSLESKNQFTGDKEYANLGDIRSQLMPKKPERASTLSVASRESETEEPDNPPNSAEAIQQVAPEEEDHYSYLDDPEASRSASSSDSVTRFKENESNPCSRIRPWLDLQTSYSAIAATNYELLAELITSSLNENTDNFKLSGKCLKFKDFILEDEVPEVILPNRIICNAVLKAHAEDKIMLMIIPRKKNTPLARNQTRFPVLASFSDYIPKEFLIGEDDFGSVYILQRSRITTVQKFAEDAAAQKSQQHLHLRNYCFILLQLINTLKSLQAEGIEEVNFDLEQLLLVTTNEEKPPTFVLLPEDKTYLTFCDTLSNRKTLCQATLGTLYHFLNIVKVDELKNCSVNDGQLAQPVAHTFSAIAKVLSEEKASSLTQAKGLLEYMLWGPVDIKVSEAQTDDVLETVLQRWLDLQRAQMVKSILSQMHLKANCNTHMHVFEEYQLVFLLQASVKSLKNVISKL